MSAAVTACARAAALALLLASTLAGCALGLGGPGHDPIARALDAVPGRYDTRAQFDGAPAAWRREPAVGHPYDWLDRQSGEFRFVEVPALAGRVMYLEWRAGGPEGAISRQRIWRFRQDSDARWVMDFYTLREPARFVGAPRHALALLTEADLIGYGPQCALPGRVVDGAVEFRIPESCAITSRSGRSMRLEATVRFERDRILYREAGLLPDGAYAFLVPGVRELPYDFRRVR